MRRMCCLGPGSKDCFVGPEIQQQHKAVITVRAPIQGDHVESWDDVERLWEHVFAEELHAKSEDHPLLMTDPVGRSPRDR